MGKVKMKLGAGVCFGMLVLLGAVWTGQCGAEQLAAPAAIVLSRVTSPTVRATSAPSLTSATPLVKASRTSSVLSTSDTGARPNQQGPRGTVTASVLNLRQGAGASFAVIGQLRQGESVTLLDERGDWLQVQTAAGVTGWVAAKYVKFPSLSVEAQPAATVSSNPASTALQEGRVVAVTDGDTIRVLLQGQEYPVRYIGIDTPETGQPNAAAARDQNAALVSGKTVRLEKDVSDTDRYGRLLRYVWVDDIMVNAELVRQGYAQAATFPPDVKYQKKFSALQKEAQTAGRGLWQRAATAPKVANLRGGPGTNYQIVGGVKAGDALSIVARNAKGDWYQLANGAWIAASLAANAPAGLPVAAVIPTPPPTRPAPIPTAPPAVRAPQAVPVQQCDPCYPDVCIPPVSYDLDCPEVPFCQFRVTCDPHRFDGDHDGVGCEKCR
jgi:endonuclease YncB( thermonuclease family)